MEENKNSNEAFGIISIVFGIIGFFIFGIAFGIIAIICGLLSGEHNNAGFIGIILGIIDIILTLILLVLLN